MASRPARSSTLMRHSLILALAGLLVVSHISALSMAQADEEAGGSAAEKQAEAAGSITAQGPIGHHPADAARDAAEQVAKRQPRRASPDLGRLALFADPLPIPPVVDAASLPRRDGQSPKVTIGVYNVKRKFHRDLPPTKVYAFGLSRKTASVPGPTIVAAWREELRVEWANNITDKQHMLPVDRTLMVPQLKLGGVPIAVHVHGAQVSSKSDGHPFAWWTNQGERGPTFASNTYTYPNGHAASTLWYHDHTSGMTRLNVLAGMFGAYIIRHPALEQKFNLPAGRFDVPLVIQDRSFMKNGWTFLASQGVSKVHPHWMPEHFGDFMTVNGKVTPYLRVERRKYRFRIVNGGTARFLELVFRAASANTDLTLRNALSASPQLPFVQIAADGGYLPAPVPLRRSVLGPGERADIVVDFSKLPAGSTVYLTNRAPAPYPGGAVPQGDLRFVMRFDVVGAQAADPTRVPAKLISIPAVDVTKAANYNNPRIISLTEVEDPASGNPESGLMEGAHFTAPVTIKPKFGTVELWYIVNLSEDTHPIHIHFAPHHILFRRRLNTTLVEAKKCSMAGGSCFAGRAVAPHRTERGRKDTSKAPPGWVTAVAVDFRAWQGKALSFDPREGPGYVLHCHILDHEDNDMMRPFVLV
ncbi:hypothetical protein CLOM_g19296 [Closterium sp. NIES-68]|nr:hypothetical protein CLOM_g19296 [Closterium sp. NIES-68]GJP58918.1 hypothetical protein CLOP_g6689 [Closterium sp. NIES-67]